MNTAYVCPHDQFGIYLLTQSMTEFVVPKVSLLGERLFNFFKPELLKFIKIKKVAKLLQSKPKHFEVEKTTVHLIYFQALFWMMLPYFPFAAPLGVLLLLLDFAFDKWFLTTFCAKSSSSIRRANALFIAFYLVTLLIFGGLYIGVWLNHPPMTECFVAIGPTDCSNISAVQSDANATSGGLSSGSSNSSRSLYEMSSRLSSPQQAGPQQRSLVETLYKWEDCEVPLSYFEEHGPFSMAAHSAPSSLLFTEFRASSSLASLLLNVSLQPYMWLGLLVITILFSNLRGYRIEVLKEFHEEYTDNLKHERFTLQNKVKDLDRLLRRERHVRQYLEAKHHTDAALDEEEDV
mmetsp:Transcript_7636/g.12980  ORF Transcript_7636/g.12980 Transcript_7636/m.12980 type:complete len:348 (-) Transcript_7636:4-1047(-)